MTLDTKTKEIYCRKCEVDIRGLIRKDSEIEGIVMDIIMEIISKIVGETYDYNKELKDFVNKICSVFPVEEGTNEETKEEAIVVDKNVNKVFIDDAEVLEDLVYQVKGLKNLGNTCYFNSAMQCINASHELVDTILKKKIIALKDKEKVPVLLLRRNLYDFFTEMRKENTGRCNPIDLLNAIRQRFPKFNGYHQQDSHELLTALLDRLIEEEQDLYKSVNEGKNLSFYGTTISKIFSSKLANKVTCKTCESVYWVFDPSVAYSLPISCKSKEVVYKHKKTKNKNRNKKKKKRAREEVELIEEVKETKEVKARDILKKVDGVGEKKYIRTTINDKEYLEPEKPPIDFDEDEQLATLNDCLDFFFHKEVLCSENGNAFYCTKCLGKFSRSKNRKQCRSANSY